MSVIRSVSSLRACLLLLAGLGVLLQAAIPAGFMPDIGKQAGSFMTICSTFGEKTVFVPDEAEGTHEQAESCVYAFTLPATGSVSVAAPAIISASIDRPVLPFDTASVIVGALDPSRPPTGPPVTA